MHAEVVAHPDGEGFYVFWRDEHTYGLRGWRLTRDRAERLASRIQRGVERP